MFLSVLAGCGDQAAASGDSTAPASDCCGDGGCCADKKEGPAAKEGDACCADKAAEGKTEPCCAEKPPEAKPAEAPKPKN